MRVIPCIMAVNQEVLRQREESNDLLIPLFYIVPDYALSSLCYASPLSPHSFFFLETIKQIFLTVSLWILKVFSLFCASLKKV